MQKMRCERKKQKKEKRKNNINVQKYFCFLREGRIWKAPTPHIRGKSTYETPDIM